MGIIRKVALLLQSTLGPKLDTIGRQTGVIQRQRKFSGASLLKMVVLTVMKSPNATTDAFVATAAQLGVVVTPEAVEKRFTEKLVSFLQVGLEHVLKQTFAAEPAAVPLLDKFTAVEVADSTTVTLPDEFEAEFPGCGGKADSGKAAVKIQVAWEMRTGSLTKLVVGPGRQSDAKSVDVDDPVAAGSLSIRDLGYFCVKRFCSIGEQGAYWISRWQQGTAVLDEEGERLDLLEFLRRQPTGAAVDVSIMLGSAERLPCRLIALRVPPEMANRRRQAAYEKAQKHGRVPTQEHLDLCDWTIFVTNCLADLLTWKEVVVLYRTRWQIELMFKLWKSHNHLAAYRGHWTGVERMALLWAKLIGVVLQHWLLLTSTWTDPRRSHWKAAQVIRDWIVTLTGALEDIDSLIRTLGDMATTIGSIAKKKRQSKRPSLFQLLSNPELLDWNP
jgi:Transposase DDE domain